MTHFNPTPFIPLTRGLAPALTLLLTGCSHAHPTYLTPLPESSYQQVTVNYPALRQRVRRECQADADKAVRAQWRARMSGSRTNTVAK